MHRKKSSEHFDTNAIFQEGLEAYQTGLNYKKNRHKNCPAFF